MPIPGFTGTPKATYEHVGETQDLESLARYAADHRQAGEIYRILQTYYPGYPWNVAVNSMASNGMAKIMLPHFYTRFPGTVRLSDIASDPGMERVKRVAGEMLQRVDLPRTGFCPAAWEYAKQRYPFADRFKPVGGVGKIK